MKSRTVSLLLTASLFLLLCVAASAASAQFTDIEKHWARDCILTFASRGFIEGYPDATFRPDKPISRAEFTCLLLNCMGAAPEVGAPAAFSDTAKHWAHAQIDEAALRGILIAGEYPNGLKPDGAILRSEAAAMMIRALGKKPDLTATAFKDESQIAKSMYRGYIKTAFTEGLMHGYPDGSFLPFSGVKRGEACTMLANLLDKLGSQGSASSSSGGSSSPGSSAGSGSSNTSGGSGGSSSLTGLVLQGNHYSLTGGAVFLKRDQANVPIYALSPGGGLISFNNTFPFPLGSATGNPDLVTGDTRYTNCRLSVSGSDLVASPASVRLDAISNGGYRYNADYVRLYIGNENGDDNLSDADLVDQQTVRIAGTSYDLGSTRITIALGDDYYAIEGISFNSGGASLSLETTGPVVVNRPDMSDIMAIFSGSKPLDLDDIDSLHLIINGALYSLSSAAIDAAGNFTVGSVSCTPDKVVLVIDGAFYNMLDARSLNGKLVFYCTESSVSWVQVNGKYRDAAGVQILKGGNAYSLDEIAVVSHNLVRIDGRNCDAGDLQCRVDGIVHAIDEIDYDDDLDLVTLEAAGSIASWSGSQPQKYVFYLNNALYRDGATGDVTIYAGGGWRSLAGISLSGASSFVYNGSSYSLVGSQIKIDGVQFAVIDAAWRVNSQILDVYLQAV